MKYKEQNEIKPSLFKSTLCSNSFKYVWLYTLIWLGSNLQFYATIQLYLLNIHICSTFSIKFDINSIRLAQLTSNLQLYVTILLVSKTSTRSNCSQLYIFYYINMFVSVGLNTSTPASAPKYHRPQNSRFSHKSVSRSPDFVPQHRSAELKRYLQFLSSCGGYNTNFPTGIVYRFDICGLPGV